MFKRNLKMIKNTQGFAPNDSYPWETSVTDEDSQYWKQN